MPAPSCHGVRPQQSAAEKLLPQHLVWVRHRRSLALAKRCEIGNTSSWEIAEEYGGFLVTIYIRLASLLLPFSFCISLSVKVCTSIPAVTYHHQHRRSPGILPQI